MALLNELQIREEGRAEDNRGVGEQERSTSMNDQ